MDEKRPLSKKERRRRQRRLEQAQKQTERHIVSAPSNADQKNSVSAEGEFPGKRPGGGKRPEVAEADIQGLKYFDKLAPLLQRLHDDGCERDQAGNRNLHFDQYCMLILLYLLCPLVTSLRGILQASELKKVQRKLGCSRASLGSWSEAQSVFDAERLKEITRELGEEFKPFARDGRIKDLAQTLTLVVGTVLSALPEIVQASWLKETTGFGLVKWRLHTHFEVDRYIPTRMDVTPIACLLISLWTGRKPTLRTCEMTCFYFIGWASEDELMRHLDKLKRQDEATATNT